MYVIQSAGQLSIEEFYVPFGGKLDPSNRWVVLAAGIPKKPHENQYGLLFNAKDWCPCQAVPDGYCCAVYLATTGCHVSGDSGADHGITLPAILDWTERLSISEAV